MKDEFISTVSHELRTPLTSLRGALGLLAGGALTTRPEKTQQMLEIAISNTDRLVRLVNDILDLERIGSGKAELQLTMCSAEDLLRPRCCPAADPAPHAPISASSTPLTASACWADPERILQVLSNLISNAIKFSPPAARSTSPPGVRMRTKRSSRSPTRAGASHPTSSNTSSTASSRATPLTPAP